MLCRDICHCNTLPYGIIPGSTSILCNQKQWIKVSLFRSVLILSPILSQSVWSFDVLISVFNRKRIHSFVALTQTTNCWYSQGKTERGRFFSASYHWISTSTVSPQMGRTATLPNKSTYVSLKTNLHYRKTRHTRKCFLQYKNNTWHFCDIHNLTYIYIKFQFSHLDSCGYTI